MITLNPDVVIFGGGVAGLWTLDELVRRGYDAILIEAARLGAGQTVASQGIIHGGLKYTLAGLLTPAARKIRDMPQVWRDCLAGRREPDLSAVTILAEHCHLWTTDTIRSKIGQLGASVKLRVKPTKLDRADWPAALRECPGEVLRLDEQVIDPVSLVAVLGAKHRERLIRWCDRRWCENPFSHPQGRESFPATVADQSRARKEAEADPNRDRKGAAPMRDDAATPQTQQSNSQQPNSRSLVLHHPNGGEALRLRPAAWILTAGRGNTSVAELLGIPPAPMQLRPLHMVMVRGQLPELYGHCTDAAETRVTITSAPDPNQPGDMVWQVGGRIAEQGVNMDAAQLLAHAKQELQAVLPGVDFKGTRWAAYRIDRAEGKTPTGARPNAVQLTRHENTIQAWPTKLALAPQLATQIVEALGEMLPHPGNAGRTTIPANWPRPEPAGAPWENYGEWAAF